MIIKRNNKEIVLTAEECRLAHDEYIRDCYKDDIMGKFEQLVSEGELSITSEVYRMMSQAEIEYFEEKAYAAFEKGLKGNTSYWEAFWDTVESAIKEAEQEYKNISYWTLTQIFRKHEQLQEGIPYEQRTHLTAHIVFTQSSFNKPYEEKQRTYIVSSDNKAYQPNKGGYSIYGSSLDGTDIDVRLERYMKVEKGGKDGWIIEDIKLIREEKRRYERKADVGDTF